MGCLQLHQMHALLQRQTQRLVDGFIGGGTDFVFRQGVPGTTGFGEVFKIVSGMVVG